MQTKMQYTALVACALLIIPAAAFAQTGSGQQNQVTLGQQSYLNAMLARVTCQTNFETGIVSAAISDIPNIDQTAISSDSSKINTDLQTLTSDANTGNREQLKTDLKTFRTDSKTTTMDLRTAIKSATPSSDQKTKLKSDMANLKATLKSCMFSASQQFANARIMAYDTGIQKVQNRTNILASKGVDTTKLNQLINQAQTNLGNLAASVSTATNSSQLKAALQSYCQYNGCKSGTNFHLAAQSALAAEQAVLDKIKSNPNSGQYSSQIDQAQTDLTNAENILNAVGTSKYQDTQHTDVWNALHDAHGIIKQLLSELNGHGHKSTGSSSSNSSGSS
jgi:hypothetical protein